MHGEKEREQEDLAKEEATDPGRWVSVEAIGWETVTAECCPAHHQQLITTQKAEVGTNSLCVGVVKSLETGELGVVSLLSLACSASNPHGFVFSL